jgi:hypothetical protein
MVAEDDTTLYAYVGEHDDHNFADDCVQYLQWRGVPVQRYQIIYLAGALCFAVSGLLDIINKRSLWQEPLV